MKMMRLMALSIALLFTAASLHALNFYSLGAESRGSYTLQDLPLASSITNVNDSYGFNIAVSGMGKKKFFFIWDLRLQVGFMSTNVNATEPDLTFYGGDVMGGFGYRVLAPAKFGIEIAPTLSAYLDITASPLGFLVQYGPALGLNAFLKLGKGFGVGARVIAKYSIPTHTFQPSVQLGVLF